MTLTEQQLIHAFRAFVNFCEQTNRMTPTDVQEFDDWSRSDDLDATPFLAGYTSGIQCYSDPNQLKFPFLLENNEPS